MIITIAFEKPYEKTFSKEWVLNNIIRLGTWSKYAHCEMIINDKWVASGNPAGTGVKLNTLRPLTDKWVYFDLEVDGRKLKTVEKFLAEQEGSSYDFMGALFGAGFNIERADKKDKWFCSELLVAILIIFGLVEFQCETPSDYSPGDLHRVIQNLQD